MDYKYSDRMANLNGAATREIMKFLTRPEIISFAGGFPATQCLPNREIEEITSEILSGDRAVAALQYGSTEGFVFFREKLIDFVKDVGIRAELDELLVISGGQQGIDLMSKVFVDKGDVILVESPTYLTALQIFESYQAKVIGVRSNADGIDLTDLEQKIIEYKPKFFYTVPTFSNPTGITYSVENRKAIAKITAKHHTMVLEDDPYSRLRFTGTAVPSLKSFDEAGNVVYLTSFSKIVAPGLRIGVATGSKEVIRKLAIAKQGVDVSTSNLSQLIINGFIEKGYLGKNIKKSLPVYLERKHAMIEAIKRYMPEEYQYNDPDGGLFIWGEIKAPLNVVELIPEAIEKYNVAYIQGTVFYADGTGQDKFRLNFSNTNPEQIERGIKSLGTMLKDKIAACKK